MFCATEHGPKLDRVTQSDKKRVENSRPSPPLSAANGPQTPTAAMIVLFIYSQRFKTAVRYNERHNIGKNRRKKRYEPSAVRFVAMRDDRRGGSAMVKIINDYFGLGTGPIGLGLLKTDK